MGCDIHCYIEYRDRKRQDYWYAFGGRINPGRNYEMFGKLAGVRYAVEPVAEPRGVPDQLGWSSGGDNQLYISDTPSEGYVTSGQAASWVEQGTSQYINGAGGKPTWVTHPDWHTHSWLTTSEWQAALDAVPHGCEYDAMLAAMKAIENRGYECRVVFWFDN